MDVQYNTRLAMKENDIDNVIDLYNDHRFELRFDAIFEYFRVGHYLGNRVELILTETIDTKQIIGCCAIMYVHEDDKLIAISLLGLVHRDWRRKQISKILSKASEMRCQMVKADVIVKVRHKNSKHLNFKKLQEDGYTIREQGDNFIMEKVLNGTNQ